MTLTTMMNLRPRPIAPGQKQRSRNFLTRHPQSCTRRERNRSSNSAVPLAAPCQEDFSQCLVHNPLANRPGFFCVWAQAILRLDNEPELPFNSHS